MLDKPLNIPTNMKYGLLICWLLQVNLDGSPYLRETHVVWRNRPDTRFFLFRTLTENKVVNCRSGFIGTETASMYRYGGGAMEVN